MPSVVSATLWPTRGRGTQEGLINASCKNGPDSVTQAPWPVSSSMRQTTVTIPAPHQAGVRASGCGVRQAGSLTVHSCSTDPLRALGTGVAADGPGLGLIGTWQHMFSHTAEGATRGPAAVASLGRQAPRPCPAWLSPRSSLSPQWCPCVLGRWDSCVDRPHTTSGLRLSRAIRGGWGRTLLARVRLA